MSWKGIGRLFFAFMTAASMYGGKAEAQDLMKDTRIAFSSNGKIMAIKPDGTDLETIVEDVPDNDDAISWSPDGRSLLYIAKDKNIRIINIYGDRKITDTGLNGYYPSWFPDMDDIIYSASNDSTYNIYRADTTKFIRTQITDNRRGVYSVYPEISPISDRLFYVEGDRLISAKIDNTDKQILVGGSYYLSISPDGLKLLFARYAATTVFRDDLAREIFLYDITDKSIKRLTFSATNSDNAVPIWSPDESHIAYSFPL